MEIKYKLGDVAKQLNLPNKKLADLLAPLGVEGAKHTTTLNEAQLNYLFDRLTAENSEVSLDAFLDTAPKPQPKLGEVPADLVFPGDFCYGLGRALAGH